ncbi:uncharacterized protein JCM10292_004365 [Rhodotorula paludigena]|uniref:uncharacterized protein n=1 Tax=Rhodotorula paludigena TaxID=86838 RepID=UPI003174AE0D
MAALAAYADEPESWDDEADLELPSGSLLQPHLVDPSLSLSPPSEPDSPHADPESSWIENVQDDEDVPRTRDEENESSVDSSRTTSTTDTLKGLMAGLSLEAEATLSLDSLARDSSPPAPPPLTLDDQGLSTPRMSKTTTMRGSSPLSLILSSTRAGPGKVHHLGSTPHGKAQPVDDGDWDQDLEGLDALQLGAPGPTPDGGLRVVAKKGSFASHISFGDDDAEGDDADAGGSAHLPQVARKRISIASFTDTEDTGEDGFELPDTLSVVQLAPSLASRASITSLKSDLSVADSPGDSLRPSAVDAAPPRTPVTASLAVPGSTSAYTSASSAPSTPGPLTPSRSSDDDAPSSALDEDDDADFFDELVLPSYFLGGAKRPSTPPTSEGEPDSDARADKVDLQSILRAKLEERGGRGLLFHGTSTGTTATPSSPQEQERLERHREPEEQDGADLARELRRRSISGPAADTAPPHEAPRAAELDDDAWSAHEMRERMRTISGARAREAQLAKEAREAQRAQGSRIGMLRRTASDGKVPPLPLRRGTGTMPPPPSRSATTGQLPRSGGAGAVRSGIPQPIRPSSAHAHERPPSAASSHSTESNPTRRRGPPPAPSTASRDRVRTRSTTLRTVPSMTGLRSSDSSKTRPQKLDLPPPPAASSTSKQSLSPVPMTPSTPSSAARPALRTKRSQQHLSATATASPGRTLERKRSLQNLSFLASPTPGVHQTSSTTRPRSRQNSLRSPSPAGGSLPSFAAPTAASSSRVRERVQSNPAPLIRTSPSNTSLSSLAARPPATPSGAPSVSERLLRSTFASASKTRSLPRPSSPNKPSLSPSPRLPGSAFFTGIRLPSAALTLSRPLHNGGARLPPREYGDGTELDGFDDLPVSKERERERVVVASRKSSGASTATLRSGGGGSWGRKEGSKFASAVGAAAARADPRGRTLQGRKEASAMAAGDKKEKRTGDPEKKKVKKRREPHLIRHLGGASAIKVQGEMTYNPILQRWEGNEGILRDFDKALATSTRPALISPFSSILVSPNRGSFGQAVPASASNTGNPKVILPPGDAPHVSRATAKVVGDMVFDPSTCSWHAVGGVEAEEELELDWGATTSGGEVADDEDPAGATSELDGWELGERQRMLQHRASFVLEEGSEEDESVVSPSAAGSGEGEAKRRARGTKRQIWRESKEAEERSREELREWLVEEPEAGDGRKWLWELRALVLGLQ